MNILAVDDEPLMLWQLTENLKRIFEKPEYRVSGFDEVDDVMEWLDAQEKGSIAYAFLDIKLRGMSGIELAKDIRERSPETMLICGKEAKANRQQSLLFRSKRNMVEMFISLCYTIIRI